MEIISKPLSGVDLFNTEARVTICQGKEESPASSNSSEDNTQGNPATQETLTSQTLTGSEMCSGAFVFVLLRIIGENELDKATSYQT